MKKISNFFKKRDKLDENRIVYCPMAKKRHLMEKGSNICPYCGKDLDNDFPISLVGHYTMESEE